MDIKLKYRAWVGQEHADIASPLINTDIEKFAIEFAEWLVKNGFMPDISNCEHEGNPTALGTDKRKCKKCGEYYTGSR